METISWTELLKLIFMFIVIVGVFIPLGVGLYNFFSDKPDKQTLANLITLASEVNSLQKGNTISVPLYIQKGFVILSYDKDNKEKLPSECKTESCLCLYRIKNDPTKDPPFKCEITRDIKYTQSGVKIFESGDQNITQVQNVDVINDEGKISFGVQISIPETLV